MTKRRIVGLLTALVSIALAVSCGGNDSRRFVSRGGVNFETKVAEPNSLEAADLAARAGFYAVQTDCGITRDSAFIVLSEPVLNLKDYLVRCRKNGLKVFIEPHFDDSTGILTDKMTTLADSVMGRGNYSVTMEGCDVMKACLSYQEDQKRFDSFIDEECRSDIDYILTDFAAPDYRVARKKGKTVLKASSTKEYLEKVTKYAGNYDPMAVIYGMDDKTTVPPLKYGAIYVDMTFTGIGDLVVDEDMFIISANGYADGKRRIRYNRLVHDCVPNIMIDALSSDFKVLSFEVRVLEF